MPILVSSLLNFWHSFESFYGLFSAYVLWLFVKFLTLCNSIFFINLNPLPYPYIKIFSLKIVHYVVVMVFRWRFSVSGNQ